MLHQQLQVSTTAELLEAAYKTVTADTIFYETRSYMKRVAYQVKPIGKYQVYAYVAYFDKSTHEVFEQFYLFEREEETQYDDE